jgi:hypothetical protein
MPSINRGTLPANFLDSVNAGMRLPTPEPQYLFAQMALGGRLRSMAIEANVDNAESFVRMMGSGEAVPPGLASLIRVADALPDAVMTVDKFGLGQGDTVKLRRNIYEGGGYTESDREVKPDIATDTTSQNVKMEEVPMILKEFEGPYNSAASAVRPYGLRDFDARYRANRDELVGLVKHHLTRDHIKWLDTVIRDRFRATTNITYADGVSNVLSFTAGAGHNASMDLFMRARQAIADREWQPFASGRYTCLVPTVFNVQMLGDSDYKNLSSQHRDANQIFRFITSIQDVDYYECSTLKTYAAGDTVPTDGNAVPTSATVYEALMFGPGGVGMGTGMPPTCFDADDTNFGKEAKVIWRSIQSFQTVDQRAIQRVLFQA